MNKGITLKWDFSIEDHDQYKTVEPSGDMAKLIDDVVHKTLIEQLTKAALKGTNHA